jgi:hypothetical protein
METGNKTNADSALATLVSKVYVRAKEMCEESPLSTINIVTLRANELEVSPQLVAWADFEENDARLAKILREGGDIDNDEIVEAICKLCVMAMVKAKLQQINEKRQ